MLDEFIFKYRVTPHSMTGISPAELLLVRKLRDKLTKLKIQDDVKTEADWQVLLRECDARMKQRQKEYADSKYSDSSEVASVFLRQKHENKFSPN